MKNLKFAIPALIAILSFTSCSKDDNPAPVNENEVITTITATFTPQDGGDPIVLQSRDIDGDGPGAPVVTVSGNFTTGTTYNGTVTFMNELASPVENITDEVHEESDQHQIFFQQSGLGTFSYADQDVNGKPVGLNFTFTASPTPASGLLTITLRHQPDKNGTGVSDGNIANAGGSTDAEVNFTVSVVAP